MPSHCVLGLGHKVGSVLSRVLFGTLVGPIGVQPLTVLALARNHGGNDVKMTVTESSGISFKRNPRSLRVI